MALQVKVGVRGRTRPRAMSRPAGFGLRTPRLLVGAALIAGLLAGLGAALGPVPVPVPGSGAGADTPGQGGATLGHDTSATALLSTNFWLATAQGDVWNFGNAGAYGSAEALHLADPIVGITPTPDGQGYWLVASDGGIFTFGDAAFYGPPAPSR